LDYLESRWARFFGKSCKVGLLFKGFSPCETLNYLDWNDSQYLKMGLNQSVPVPVHRPYNYQIQYVPIPPAEKRPKLIDGLQQTPASSEGPLQFITVPVFETKEITWDVWNLRLILAGSSGPELVQAPNIEFEAGHLVIRE
jgi:hypothetical protein